MIDIKATKILKKAIFYKKNKKKIRAHLLILILRYVFAFEAYVSERTQIGKNVQFKHNGLGCVLHHRVKINDNCWIYQNVTIGANTRYVNGELDNTGAPIIGKNTVIYAGAVIVGPVTVGDNCVIGANSVVTRDIPNNSLVYGNPCSIKSIKEGVEYITPENFFN